ncbi:non-hydrolyzing UDP-N-acetylglucosamine 2-epimerase [Hydrogenophaga sp.]|uniref:non-hydrolyzing UDP-N-acetylglucosamine 2-epimerase n=1 Tax=Hydrogenophaga sp. TaxID=1904254 RepID=UPI0027332273|nr:UDP-N-acetylglucosamine 2-epimerase (non-hydrolyzing) [Hydrogenophaga sp.]MDP3884878.1 UDP-N-acetylglucosamine 2-epimerase (non-hydrolyzing) [Hydrogenophaga sp.]
MKNRIAVLVGTRPEAIKLVPVYLALQQSENFEPVLISTGQHREMLAGIFELFSVRPDIELNVMRENQTLVDLTSKLFHELGAILTLDRFRCVIVQGDTTTALAGAVTAHYSRIPVAHVEAGLRTYNNQQPFPEEANRRMISVVTDFHFAPTGGAVNALALEGITGNVFCVGNTVIDSLLTISDLVDRRTIFYENRFADFVKKGERLVLVTGHRRESFGQGFKEICLAISRIASAHPDIKIVYPVHLNPNVRGIVFESLSGLENVRLIDPVPYDEMIYLMKCAWMILTDSGGIQEEAPSLNVPLIIMREVTERPEVISAGCGLLAGVDSDSIFSMFERIANSPDLYRNMSTARNPFGDGKSAQQIANKLNELIIL